MEKRHFTVGLAGHIDHGKTTLTKALTGVDTDRLKEEKERNISIEPGFAPLLMDEEMTVSIIDVPGHERFIRQMIAGVAGIDVMLLVVAADEGVMAQTKEHLDILELLGIQSGIVVVTKINRVERELLELVQEEIEQELQGTVFSKAPVMMVDSISMEGIEELKTAILAVLEHVQPRDASGSFRMPIDQVFTVKGHGTVVRGTVYEGTVREGQEGYILPAGWKVRVRQIQVHNAFSSAASAGQRAALNLAGTDKEDIKRGDVITSDKEFFVTDIVDVAVTFLEGMNSSVKQRSFIKCYIGTAEVTGKIVFFDRNEVEEGADVLCQLRLDSPVAARRGDRFILRRPSPAETIGGGAVIDPKGATYKFGAATIELLRRKREGTPQERVRAALCEHKLLGRAELLRAASLEESEWESVLPHLLSIGSLFTLREIEERAAEEMRGQIGRYHEVYPLRPGMKKAQLFETLSSYPNKLLDLAMRRPEFRADGQYAALQSFTPGFPRKWETRMRSLLEDVQRDSLAGKAWSSYVQAAGIPSAEGEDLYRYLLGSKIYAMGNGVVWADAVRDAMTRLREGRPSSFTVQEAKEVLGLSRKPLIVLLELLDELGYTKRVEQNREWR